MLLVLRPLKSNEVKTEQPQNIQFKLVNPDQVSKNLILVIDESATLKLPFTFIMFSPCLSLKVVESVVGIVCVTLFIISSVMLLSDIAAIFNCSFEVSEQFILNIVYFPVFSHKIISFLIILEIDFPLW